jgi:hypothetical protein
MSKEKRMDIAHEPMVTAPSETAIWNPNAAANWSLLFTPTFGAYLHMLNWRALDEPRRAESARRWFYASVVLLVLYFLGFSFLYSFADTGLFQAVGLVFLVAWYFASARPQVKYVQTKYGKTYERRHWGTPLLCAFGGLLAYWFVLGAFIANTGAGAPGH